MGRASTKMEEGKVTLKILTGTRSILILSSHLCLGLHKGLFPVGLPVKMSNAKLYKNLVLVLQHNLRCQGGAVLEGFYNNNNNNNNN